MLLEDLLQTATLFFASSVFTVRVAGLLLCLADMAWRCILVTTRLGGSGFFGSLEAAYASTSLPLPSFSNSTLENETLRLGVESLFFLSQIGTGISSW